MIKKKYRFRQGGGASNTRRGAAAYLACLRAHRRPVLQKNSTLAKCFKVEELRIHTKMQPLIFITRPPPKCNRLLHVFFISIISGQPANDVFPVLPKSKRQTPPRIKGFFPPKKYEPSGKILTDVSRPTDPLQNRHLPIPADIIRRDSDNRPGVLHIRLRRLSRTQMTYQISTKRRLSDSP